MLLTRDPSRCREGRKERIVKEYKQYLGDGVHVDFDGFQVCLKTDGISGDNTIYLEPSVMKALMCYVEAIAEDSTERSETDE